MRSYKIFVLLTIILLSGLSPIFLLGYSNQAESKPYWYSSTPFKINSSDYWLPFFSFSDVPGSLPLRGYTEDTRNWFIDLGAFEWFSDWVQNVWEYELLSFEENFTD
ncbi:MAG: hypothetical protein ACFFDT_30490, partial [Candidatus Hodarchaeota archaeon]